MRGARQDNQQVTGVELLQVIRGNKSEKLSPVEIVIFTLRRAVQFM